jgi:hypothetical protein
LVFKYKRLHGYVILSEQNILLQCSFLLWSSKFLAANHEYTWNAHNNTKYVPKNSVRAGTNSNRRHIYVGRIVLANNQMTTVGISNTMLATMNFEVNYHNFLDYNFTLS